MAPAQRSARARRKAQTQRTDEGLPVHSLETLLADLATLPKNRMRFGQATFQQLAQPTPLQQRAFEGDLLFLQRRNLGLIERV